MDTMVMYTTEELGGWVLGRVLAELDSLEKYKAIQGSSLIIFPTEVDVRLFSLQLIERLFST